MANSEKKNDNNLFYIFLILTFALRAAQSSLQVWDLRLGSGSASSILLVLDPDPRPSFYWSWIRIRVLHSIGLDFLELLACAKFLGVIVTAELDLVNKKCLEKHFHTRATKIEF